MEGSNVEWRTEELAAGILSIAFTGKGGIGSEGNDDGLRMTAVVDEVLSVHEPRALLIDLRPFDYEFGDWIVGAPLRAAKLLRGPRVYVLATGDTLAALQGLWGAFALPQILPLFGEPSEALEYLRKAVEESDA
jgi:hypothetical protein